MKYILILIGICTFQTLFAWDLTSSVPSPHQINVSLTSNLTFSFDDDVSLTSITNGTDTPIDDAILVVGEHTGLYSGTYSGDATQNIIFTPDNSFLAGEKIQIFISTAVQNTTGAPISMGYAFEFRTTSSLPIDGTLSYNLNQDVIIEHSITTPRIAIPADIDQDDNIDIISSSFSTNEIFVIYNNITSFSSQVVATSTSPYSITTADVDGDGDIDIVGNSSMASSISWFENINGFTFTEHVIGSVDTDNNRKFETTDIDLDGSIDIIITNVANNEILLFINNGSQSFTPQVVNNTIASPSYIYSSDIDTDGDMDILASSSTNNEIIWFENSGTSTFTPHVISDTASKATSVYAIDMDLDGDVDVISTSSGDKKLAWYENNGAQSFTEHQVVTNKTNIIFAKGSDLDGDGDIDLISTTAGSDQIHWYENDGAQNFSASLITNAHNVIYMSEPVDLDQDGDLDLISTSNTDNTVLFFENTSPAEINLYQGLVGESTITDNQSSSVDLGTFNKFSSFTETFTIENSSTEKSLIIDSITSSNNSFSINSSITSLPISSDATFDITFSSLTYGTQNTTIRIYSNDGDETVFNFDITAFSDKATDVFVSPENQQALITWLPINSVSNYTLLYKKNETGTLTSIDNITDTFYTLTNLSNDSLYFVAIAGVTDTSDFKSFVPVIHAGKALQINDESQKVTFGTDKATYMSGKKDFTAEMWINFSSDGRILTNRGKCSGSSAEQFVDLYLSANGTFNYHIRAANSNGTFRMSSSSRLTNSKWHHVAIVRKGTSHLIYIDGALDNTKSFTDTLNINISQNQAILRVSDYPCNANEFEGQLDELRVWGRALDADEINNRKDIPLDGDEEDLLGLWHFDEPDNAEFYYDATENSLNGIKVGTPTTSSSMALIPYEPLISAAKICGEDSILVSWDKNSATDVEEYQLYKSETPSIDTSNLTPYAIIDDTSFVDGIDLVYGKTYYYLVVAVDFDRQIGFLSNETSAFYQRIDTTLTTSENCALVTSDTGNYDIEWFYSADDINYTTTGITDTILYYTKQGSYYATKFLSATGCYDTTSVYQIDFDLSYLSIVTSSQDGEECGTFRRAIEYINQTDGYSSISFDTISMGGHTVFLTDELPSITANGIDINTVSTAISSPTIEIINQTSFNGTALSIDADSCIVNGLAIDQFKNGINISGNHNTLSNNYVGLPLDGTSFTSTNNTSGLVINGSYNRIGTSVDNGNVIAGFSENIYIENGEYNAILNNTIGLTFNSTTALPNQTTGIIIEGEKTSIAGNTVGGHLDYGIHLMSDGDSSFLFNNTIGVNTTGLYIDANNWKIGGTTIDSFNVIDNNGEYGIAFSSTATQNQIIGNSIYLNGDKGIMNSNVPIPTSLTINDDTLSGLSTLSDGTLVQVYADQNTQGRVYLGSTEVNNGTWEFSLNIDTLPAYLYYLTATQTEENLSTSAFSDTIKFKVCDPLFVTSNGDELQCGDFRYAIIYANQSLTKDTITFNELDDTGIITLTSTLPPISSPIHIDGQNIPRLYSTTSINSWSIEASNTTISGISFSDIISTQPLLKSNGYDSLSIINCNFGLINEGVGFGETYSNALEFTDGTNHLIQNNHFAEAQDKYISFDNVDHSEIRENTFGMNLPEDELGTIALHHISLSNASDSNVIVQNTFSSSQENTLVIEQSNYNTINTNNFGSNSLGEYKNNWNTAASWIYLSDSYGDTISNNMLLEALFYGIHAEQTHHSLVQGNHFGIDREKKLFTDDEIQYTAIVLAKSTHNQIGGFNTNEMNTIAHASIGILINTDSLNTLWGNEIYKITQSPIQHLNAAQSNVQPPVISLGKDSLITGTASPSALIQLYADQNTQAQFLLDTIYADDNGDWSYQVTQDDLDHMIALAVDSLTALQDSSSNTSMLSNSLRIIYPEPIVFKETYFNTLFDFSLKVNMPTAISDPSKVLDTSSIEIIGGPYQNELTAFITNGILYVDFSDGTSGNETDSILVSACDVFGECDTSYIRITQNDIPFIEPFNVLSPNGDDINDCFRIDNIELFDKESQVTVYDKWGHVVFKTTHYQNGVEGYCWDGFYNNKRLTQGTYYYTIRLFLNGKRYKNNVLFDRSGFIELDYD